MNLAPTILCFVIFLTLPPQHPCLTFPDRETPSFPDHADDTISPSAFQPNFANLPPISFGTLNPAYEGTEGLSSLLASLPRGTLLDTAERYGSNDGDAERELAAAADMAGLSLQSDLLVCTKFAPKPWRTNADSLVSACRASAQRLGVDSIYLYQLHFSDAVSQPLKLFGYVDNKDETYWEGLAQCYHMGLVKNVGVCNYGPKNIRAAHKALSELGVPLVSNQINYNLMRHRSSIEIKSICDELGIQVLGYHPLGSGVLTGKYNEDYFRSIPGGLSAEKSKALRVKWYQKNCSPVIDAVKDIADRRGKTASQVAINWCFCKGVIPICGARSTEHALEALGANKPEIDGEHGWRLSEHEIKELDSASAASAEFARGFELI